MTFSTLKNGSGLKGALIPRVRSVALRGPAGRLEGILNEGSPKAKFAALVCHPHPLGGGTMHNKVVYHAMKVLNAPVWGFEFPVLRFNFRGTGLSEGVHDGAAETGDVLAALDWLRAEYGLPLVVAGFSFGAVMAMMACCWCNDQKVKALAALGLPMRSELGSYEYSFLGNCSLPKIFISGDQDQFAPVDDIYRVTGMAAGPRRLELIRGADHFFTGHVTEMQSVLSAWLKETV